MRGIGHAMLAGGLYTAGTFTGPYFSLPVLGGIILGSYLPDADTVKSPAALWPMWILAKHRTWHHSVVVGLAYTLVISIFDMRIGLGVGVGYLLHLFADNLTPMGCHWMWWPLHKG